MKKEFDRMTTDNILLVIAVITGFVGMPIIQFVKSKFGLDANWALLLATGISLVLAVLVAVLGGMLALGQPVTIDLVSESAGIIFSIATLFYKALLGDKS